MRPGPSKIATTTLGGFDQQVINSRTEGAIERPVATRICYVIPHYARVPHHSFVPGGGHTTMLDPTVRRKLAPRAIPRCPFSVDMSWHHKCPRLSQLSTSQRVQDTKMFVKTGVANQHVWRGTDDSMRDLPPKYLKSKLPAHRQTDPTYLWNIPGRMFRLAPGPSVECNRRTNPSPRPPRITRTPIPRVCFL